MEKTTIQDIENWLAFLKTLKEGNTQQHLIPRFYKPYHFSTLATFAKKTDFNEFDFFDENTKNYAIRMNLWEASGLEQPNFPMRRQAARGRFIEARSITSENDVHQVSVYIQEVLDNSFNSKISHKTVEDISTVISELLGNCSHHAESSIGIDGLICAQVWENGDLAQIAIADAGIGIRETLSRNSALNNELSSCNACELATKYEKTGKPRPNGDHSGYGLTLAKDILLKNDGNLIVLSGKEIYQNCEGNTTPALLENSWSGTLVIFEWNLNNPLDLGAVYDDWDEADKSKGNYNEELEDIF